MPTAQEKAQRDEGILFRQFKAWRREQIEALCVGPHGAEVRALRTMLLRLGPKVPPPLTGRELVEHIEGAAWLRGADDHTRRVVLGMISAALAWGRQQRGLEPLDDPMWDQPKSAWIMIREMLGVRVVAEGGGNPP